jgi:hypothetical protein
LRRLIIIGTALAVLVGASAAYAAFSNSYAGTKVFWSPKKAGSSSKPAPLGETEVLKAASSTSGNRAAPLIDIKTTFYGIRFNGGKMPKCTDSMIEANKTEYNKACPKGSLIGGGPVTSLLGPASTPSASAGTACNPYLTVYNGGANTQVFFFITGVVQGHDYECAGLRTGATAPYDGHISYHGKNAVVNVPLPPDISNKVANQVGLYGSLISETLIFPISTKDAQGKTLHYGTSVACSKGKRPYSVQYTAQTYSGGTETQTVKGSDKC